PYPFPKPCTQLAFSRDDTTAAWAIFRAQGTENTFSRDGDHAVMRIAGKPECSNGYAIPLGGWDLQNATRLRITLSGTPNAKFFVDILNGAGAEKRLAMQTGWTDTPAQETSHAFDLVAPGKMERLILYTWSVDGKRAENRIRSITLEDAQGKPLAQLPLDEKSLSTPPLGGTIDLRRAVAQVTKPESNEPMLTARALADRNAFLIQSALPCRIVPTATFDCDPPQQGETGGVTWLVQELPGDGDWPGMTYAVALAQNSQTKAVAIVTSFEADDPLQAAVKLAADVLASDSAQLIAAHQRQWERFWSASGVELDDPLFRDLWYRNLYFLRCVSKPGVECVGLYAGSVTEGCPAWHGNHTLNYNAQQTFWSAPVTNHVELAEPYVRLIDRYMTRARWLCRQVFDFDGAYIPHVVLAHEPIDPAGCKSRNGRQYLHHVWGFTMGVPGFSVQNVWHRYKYAPDRDFLEQTAYPILRDVAIFQANYMDTCSADPRQAGKVILAPSMSPEHWGWSKDFARNRNGAFDIAMFRFVFRAAIEGAETLDCDSERIARWKACLDRLPDYPTFGDEEPVVVDVQDAPPITYNIAIPAVPVFPADQVTWFSPPAEKELLARSIERMRWNGNNSSVIVSVARARLSLPDSAGFMRETFQSRLKPNGTMGINRVGSGINRAGHYTEQFAASMAVSELLLQSVGDVIRIFPAWPEDLDAAFTDLRAQGGFLVSAKQSGGKIAALEITSTVGGKLRLLSPWPTIKVRTRSGEKVLKADARGVVEIETTAGEELSFAAVR
ncbi:MAG: hypothetical protein HQ581_28865, partial [Planctomycetes bacterium]|nr:hypothetical protein [Planctomycetota bacterium]